MAPTTRAGGKKASKVVKKAARKASKASKVKRVSGRKYGEFWKGPDPGLGELWRVGPQTGPFRHALELARGRGVCEYSGVGLLGVGVRVQVDHRVELCTMGTLMELAGKSFAPRGYCLPWSDTALAFVHRHLNDPGNLVAVSEDAHIEKSALGGKRYMGRVRSATGAAAKGQRARPCGILEWYGQRQYARLQEGNQYARLHPDFPLHLAAYHVRFAQRMVRELGSLKKDNDKLLCSWVARALAGLGGVPLLVGPGDLVVPAPVVLPPPALAPVGAQPPPAIAGKAGKKAGGGGSKGGKGGVGGSSSRYSGVAPGGNPPRRPNVMSRMSYVPSGMRK
jgi:hypothetical protein